MNFTKNQLIIAGVTGFFVILAGLVLAGVIPGLQTSEPEAIAAQLTIWNVGDRKEAFDPAFAEFNAKYKNVAFAYRSFPNEAAYEAALLDGLAAGTGPDIFALKSDKLLRHLNKLTSAPAALIALSELRARFPQVVEKDFYGASGVAALPLSIDTLALFYNRDLLDSAGIANVPATWDEIQVLAPTLTKKNPGGAITQAGIALGGTAGEIESGVDTLYLLMLQTGTKMTDNEFTRATFDSSEGLNALRFYLQFGNPSSPSYAWGPLRQSADGGGEGSARNRFADGKLAMLVDYASAIPLLAGRNTFLNYGVAPIPQPKDATVSLTYPSYYGFTVSRRSRFPALAWEFVKTMTTSESSAKAFVNVTGKPPALRALIATYESDPVRRVFARQILTARSWPQVDPDAIRASFVKLIASALADPLRASNALRAAGEEVTTLMERRGF
ncbi:MAG: extracellular solute-binding protein [Candidatus Jorgensenbacteria bacterium]|nr:extracellular solute-binding protein [Candidatus Jorgensenbacteria bacterium]